MTEDANILYGSYLTPEQADTLQHGPVTLTSREQLLGYHLKNKNKAAHLELVVWFINHEPSHFAHRTPWISTVLFDDDDVDLLRNLWKAKVASEPNNGYINGHAGIFFFENGNQQQADKLLLVAESLQPDNAAWPRFLCKRHYYSWEFGSTTNWSWHVERVVQEAIKLLTHDIQFYFKCELICHGIECALMLEDDDVAASLLNTASLLEANETSKLFLIAAEAMLELRKTCRTEKAINCLTLPKDLNITRRLAEELCTVIAKPDEILKPYLASLVAGGCIDNEQFSKYMVSLSSKDSSYYFGSHWRDVGGWEE